MDPGTVSQIALLVAAIGGGWATGRRGVARQTVELLQTQVDHLTRQNKEQSEKIVALEGKAEILESMVTQRAAVAEVREVVDRIAVKVGA